ncbi:hypothetical protein BZJ19_10190 [Salinivibrio proteolyticus]|uniref:hypothetical protein n=1 Tax=Salinivibrio proteolyticus TaxID=334715 RepID=UPI0009895E82|nr:hypothetical protein [Salinivibrio proteolyticus]OOF25079.1 hypothetical protein BZJ19_10190 [Salinivibrio proteolyticus]
MYKTETPNWHLNMAERHVEKLSQENEALRDQLHSLFERVSGCEVSEFSGEQVNYLADMIEGQMDANEGCIDKLKSENAALRDTLAKDAIKWLDACDKKPPYNTPILIKLKGVVQHETWQFDASDHGEFFYLHCDHLDDDIKEEFTITNKHIEGEILWARLPNS